MSAPTLEHIAKFGNRRMVRDTYVVVKDNRITCADGFSLSVIAGYGTYCSPRPGDDDGVAEDYSGPYTLVEVGYPSQRPEPWDGRWSERCDDPEEPTSSVYGYVPVEWVRDLIESHGGEA